MEIQLTSEIKVELIQHVGSDSIFVAAARTSTKGIHAEQGESEGLLRYLINAGHSSPLEHGLLTFRVHAPIMVFREWMRHRTWSFSEESGRYKQLDPIFWIPRETRKMLPIEGFKSARPEFKEANKEKYEGAVHDLHASYDSSYKDYQHMLDCGIAREVARACLPVGIYSSMYASIDPHNCLKFLALRTHDLGAKKISYPQAEIEEGARQVENYFASIFPITYKLWVENGRSI